MPIDPMSGAGPSAFPPRGPHILLDFISAPSLSIRSPWNCPFFRPAFPIFLSFGEHPHGFFRGHHRIHPVCLLIIAQYFRILF